jgi:hypothetical protein
MRCGPLGIVLSPTRFGHKVKEYPTRRNVLELQTREELHLNWYQDELEQVSLVIEADWSRVRFNQMVKLVLSKNRKDPQYLKASEILNQRSWLALSFL